MPEYKLTYFDVRGFGEISRQIFAVAEVPYTDFRFTHAEWPELKKTLPSPFGQVPILEVDGQVIGQSHAIARFLAKRFNLNGKGEFEEAKVNEIADQVKDYQTEIRPYFVVFVGFAQGDKEKLYKDVFVPAFTKHFTFFNNILKKNGTGHLVGNGLTWADLLIAQIIADVKEHWPAEITQFPELSAFQEKIHSIPALKKWIETRPKSLV